MTKSIPSEHAEQATLVQWFERQYPQYGHLLVASMNGAYLAGNARQRAIQINRAKQAGLRTGFPDLFLPVPSKQWHGLFIEMKRTKNSSTSKEQKQWISELNTLGYVAVVCKGHRAAVEVINEYLSS